MSGGQPAAAATVKANCNNTTADSSTIQSAINGSAPGDEIVIDGPCRITATIRLVGNRSYRGDSPSTTLTLNSGSNQSAVLASDCWWNDSAKTCEPITLRDLTDRAGLGGPADATRERLGLLLREGGGVG